MLFVLLLPHHSTNFSSTNFALGQLFVRTWDFMFYQRHLTAIQYVCCIILRDAVVSLHLKIPGCFELNLRIARTTREGYSRRERVWRAARHGMQQVKLRGNRRGVALPKRSFSCGQLNGITALQSDITAKPYPDSATFPRPRSYASPVLDTRDYRFESCTG